MHSSCEQCGELLRKYGVAATTYVRLDNKLRFAALQRDCNLVQMLTLESERAEKTRSELRQSIHDHEATHLSSAAALATHG
jgi:hypothetical protein